MGERPAAGSPGQILRDGGLRPRKSLGQNFLHEVAYVRRIVDALELGRQDVVLEIGAGTGALTGALAERAGRVVALELDQTLVPLLRLRFAGTPQVEVRHVDALAFDPCCISAERYKLVGNIPYYITAPLLRHFLEAGCAPDVLVLMVQREVADRITARPGNLSMLAVSVQYYARPEIVVRVPAGAFYPRPNVDSAVIRLVPHARRPDPALTGPFFSMVRAGFGARRKQLINTISSGLHLTRADAEVLLRQVGVDPTRRAETLTLDEWRHLTRQFLAAHSPGNE